MQNAEYSNAQWAIWFVKMSNCFIVASSKITKKQWFHIIRQIPTNSSQFSMRLILLISTSHFSPSLSFRYFLKMTYGKKKSRLWSKHSFSFSNFFLHLISVKFLPIQLHAISWFLLLHFPFWKKNKFYVVFLCFYLFHVNIFQFFTTEATFFLCWKISILQV